MRRLCLRHDRSRRLRLNGSRSLRLAQLASLLPFGRSDHAIMIEVLRVKPRQ